MIHRWSHVQEFEGHQDLDYETIILPIKLSIMRLSCLSQIIFGSYYFFGKINKRIDCDLWNINSINII